MLYLAVLRKPCKIPQSNIMKNNFSLFPKNISNEGFCEATKAEWFRTKRGEGITTIWKVFPRNKFNYKCLILCKKLNTEVNSFKTVHCSNERDKIEMKLNFPNEQRHKQKAKTKTVCEAFLRSFSWKIFLNRIQ